MASRKNRRNSHDYLRVFLDHARPNPIAKNLREGQYHPQVVPNKKHYDRKKEKDCGDK